MRAFYILINPSQKKFCKKENTVLIPVKSVHYNPYLNLNILCLCSKLQSESGKEYFRSILNLLQTKKIPFSKSRFVRLSESK